MSSRSSFLKCFTAGSVAPKVVCSIELDAVIGVVAGPNVSQREVMIVWIPVKRVQPVPPSERPCRIVDVEDCHRGRIEHRSEIILGGGPGRYVCAEDEARQRRSNHETEQDEE